MLFVPSRCPSSLRHLPEGDARFTRLGALLCMSPASVALPYPVDLHSDRVDVLYKLRLVAVKLFLRFPRLSSSCRWRPSSAAPQRLPALVRRREEGKVSAETQPSEGVMNSLDALKRHSPLIPPIEKDRERERERNRNKLIYTDPDPVPCGRAHAREGKVPGRNGNGNGFGVFNGIGNG